MEVHIQHYNIAKSLLKINDEHLHFCRNLETEKQEALSQLNLPNNAEAHSMTGRSLRSELWRRSFNNWCRLPQKGKGMVTYSEDPKNKSWISNRSSSEWTNAIKMSTNIAAVRSVPGRSFQDQKYPHPGCSEVETLGHVLGYCPKGELMRNNRHHKVRSSIATTLRKAKWEVYEEVHCLAENGSTRRADIIAIDRRNQRSLILDPTVRFEKDDQQANNVNNEKKSIYNPCIPHFSERYKMNINTWEVKGLLFGARGTSFKLTLICIFVTNTRIMALTIIAIKNNSAYILDPTIRFETHADQPHEVDSEKKRIYEPTIPFYKDKYSLSHIDVIGLMVGARGTIPSFFANKCKNLGLTHSIVKEIAISALKGSVQILRNHLYGSDNGNLKLS
ncbi:hypothetical protein ANN_12643 [Periplaneta americana]|uniref:Uncharacterized protein n=1 Tax=Periplaneta americana TaxID=6978 RepID=A0ABQ8TJ18_PERAM|nr:hypothetical protein ANN_12643 [Periplaneta americana]